MKVVINPDRKDWQKLLQRPYVDNSQVLKTVEEIIENVKANGDAALKEYAQKFDKTVLSNLLVTEEEFAASVHRLDNELMAAIMMAASNIKEFHEKQLSDGGVTETTPGVFCWRKSVPVEKLGLYIPGGTAPLFSTVLMLGLPAKIAGCKEIILCTPPSANGEIHPAILFCAKLAGITKIYKAGGAQAIAAMAFGTETIPQVYKIFGPGNQYVTAAKQLVQMQGIAIDLPAGPSEVCVLADDSANPTYIAADLLSQAEHGADSQVLFVTTSQQLVEKVQEELSKQLDDLPRKNFAEKSLQNSRAIVVQQMNVAIEMVNEYAPEHLIICTKDAETIADRITNAGSVFIGNFSPESVGDYASGTNHTLPTNGYAKAYSGVSLDSFVKKITFQKLTQSGLHNIGKAVIKMAEAEGLHAHANAVKIRLKEDNVEKDLQQPHEAFSAMKLARNNIRDLKPYSSARSEFSGRADIFLDANENSFGSPTRKWYNRYPDPLQWQLKKKIGSIKQLPAENILLGNGSDECIDLLFRAFAEPKVDNVIICPPTYGMYEVSAHINNVAVKEVPLLSNFQLNIDALEQEVDVKTKMIFLCSPNNPTGNSLEREDIELVLNNFNGLVILDEAYINYSRQRSFISELQDYPNLVILQTFSKAWGLAGLRLGMLFASTEIIEILNKIKPPYNINEATQEIALNALDKLDDVNEMIRETVRERLQLFNELQQLSIVQKVYPSDANFLLVKIEDANGVYLYLKEQGIIVRNRSNVILCENCLRITVGTSFENKKLITALQNYITSQKPQQV